MQVPPHYFMGISRYCWFFTLTNCWSTADAKFNNRDFPDIAVILKAYEPEWKNFEKK